MSKSAPFRLEAATADLLQAVSRATAVVERRNTIPILGCLKFVGADGRARIFGTDLDTEVTSECEAAGEGETCLPAHRLLSVLRAVAHVERLEMTTGDKGTVTLTAGEFSATMNTLPAADFPHLKQGDKIWSAELAEGVLKFLFGGVMHAISHEETRYYLNGVCLEIKDGKLLAVATDGHQLAQRESGLPVEITDQPSIIVPRKAATLAVSHAGSGEATFTAKRSEPDGRAVQADIEAGGVRLRTKLIDGKYPDWRRVVPVPSNTSIEISTRDLRRALKLTGSNFLGQVCRPTRIASQGHDIVVSSRSPGDGEAKARLPGQITGELPEVGIDAQFLDSAAAAMERIGSKTMRIYVTDRISPVRIAPDEAIAGVLNVIMPMRL